MTTLHATINALASKLAHELLASLRNASLDQIIAETAAGHVARRGPGRPPKTQPTKVHAATTTVKRAANAFAAQPKTSQNRGQGRLGFEESQERAALGAIAEDPSPREEGHHGAHCARAQEQEDHEAR